MAGADSCAAGRAARDGKILRYREFYEEAAALQASGLSEQDLRAAP